MKSMIYYMFTHLLKLWIKRIIFYFRQGWNLVGNHKLHTTGWVIDGDGRHWFFLILEFSDARFNDMSSDWIVYFWKWFNYDLICVANRKKIGIRIHSSKCIKTLTGSQMLLISSRKINKTNSFKLKHFFYVIQRHTPCNTHSTFYLTILSI